MKAKRIATHRGDNQKRRGFAALEVVMSLGVTFTFSVSMYYVAEIALRGLYHIIGTEVGWPYM